MNIQTEKYLAIHQILQINDELLIKTVRNLLDYGLKNQQEESAEAVTDFWDELSDVQKQKIERSIQQLESGQGIPHKQVMSEFRQKYQK